jgi:hypothetical protein
MRAMALSGLPVDDIWAIHSRITLPNIKRLPDDAVSYCEKCAVQFLHHADPFEFHMTCGGRVWNYQR